jgi:hypothetical protein
MSAKSNHQAADKVLKTFLQKRSLKKTDLKRILKLKE